MLHGYSRMTTIFGGVTVDAIDGGLTGVSWDPARYRFRGETAANSWLTQANSWLTAALGPSVLL